MIGSAKSHRELYVIKASPQENVGMDYVRRPSGKPVNVAGCRERSRSSIRRAQRGTAQESEDFSSVTTDRSSHTDGRHTYSLAAKMDAALNVQPPISVAARIRKKLKVVKRFPFLKCAVSTMAHPSGESYSKQPKALKGKQGISKFGKKKTMPHDITDVEPSLKIRALFPEKSDSKTKVPLPSPLAKLKHTVLRARSTTPSNLSDTAECPTETPPLSPLYSNGARRCRRQENLVKMMEKKLEERVNPEGVQNDETPSPHGGASPAVRHVTDPMREARTREVRDRETKDHRHVRSRKIKQHRSKARKGAHRRTVTY